MTGRLDRTGDEIDPDTEGHDPRCNDGWLDNSRDSEHPRPCLDCKPHLAPARRHARAHGPQEPA